MWRNPMLQPIDLGEMRQGTTPGSHLRNGLIQAIARLSRFGLFRLPVRQRLLQAAPGTGGHVTVADGLVRLDAFTLQTCHACRAGTLAPDCVGVFSHLGQHGAEIGHSCRGREQQPPHVTARLCDLFPAALDRVVVQAKEIAVVAFRKPAQVRGQRRFRQRLARFVHQRTAAQSEDG